MYCPRCNTQNESKQKYCRQCGLPIIGIQLALEGRIDEALAEYKKGGGALSAAAVILMVCVLVALLNFFLSSEPRSYGMLINLLIGVLVALPMLIAGLVRVSRAGRLMRDKDEDVAIPLKEKQTDDPKFLPPASHKIDPLAEGWSRQASVTEHTTHKLKRGAERR